MDINKIISGKLHVIKHAEIPQKTGGVVTVDTVRINGEKVIILTGTNKDNELITMLLAGDKHARK